MIYLDNSATTQPCPACVRAMTEALTDCWGNPSSVYTLGIDAAHRLRQARQAVVNRDDPHAETILNALTIPYKTFGIREQADISALFRFAFPASPAHKTAI